MGLFALRYFRSSCFRERKDGELSLPGTYVPRSENDRELSLPRIFRSPLKRRTFASEVQCVRGALKVDGMTERPTEQQLANT